jgi:hypothetical protein
VILPYIFHPLAAAELDQAVAYYEGIQRGKGLELAVRVHAVMEQIREHPDSASVTFGSVRSVPVQHVGRNNQRALRRIWSWRIEQTPKGY